MVHPPVPGHNVQSGKRRWLDSFPALAAFSISVKPLTIGIFSRPRLGGDGRGEDPEEPDLLGLVRFALLAEAAAERRAWRR